jgi:hypothetical protein
LAAFWTKFLSAALKLPFSLLDSEVFASFSAAIAGWKKDIEDTAIIAGTIMVSLCFITVFN